MEPRVWVRLLGGMSLYSGETLVPASAFPGRQGRLAFAYLICHRRPVTRDELAEAIWGGTPPPSWPAHEAAIVSKLRALLARVGLDAASVLASGPGCYELRPPPQVEVDLDAVSAALEEAEGAVRAAEADRALGAADTAANLARRPLLAGEEAVWLDRTRARLRLCLVAALEIEVELLRQRGDLHQALRLAEEAVDLEPFRESGHVQLMRVHLAAGNRAEGLRTYQRCRELLATELGIDPGVEAQAAYRQLLHASG